jgi:hypothetical protein
MPYEDAARDAGSARAASSPRPRHLSALAGALLLLASARGAAAAPIGAPCAAAAECGSGFCVDGVCCEGACDGTCMACAVALGSTGSDGECRPVAAGIDPRDACLAEPSDTCRNVGVCDGQGRCALQAEGTPCGLSGACAAGVCVSVPLCDGDRTILGSAGPLEDCAPFRCSARHNLCFKVCSTNQDCVSGLACGVDGRCEAPVSDPPPDGGCALAGGAAPGPPALLGALGVAWLLSRAAARRRGRRGR